MFLLKLIDDPDAFDIDIDLVHRHSGKFFHPVLHIADQILRHCGNADSIRHDNMKIQSDVFWFFNYLIIMVYTVLTLCYVFS